MPLILVVVTGFYKDRADFLYHWHDLEMEKAENLTPSFEEARVWIGNVFQRFGSSFRERKAHLYEATHSTYFSSINKGWKSVPEVLTFLTDGSPKKSHEKKTIEGTASASKEFDNISHTLQSAANGQMRNHSSNTRRRSSSLSVLEVVSHSCVSKITLKYDLNGNIAPKALTEIGKTNNLNYSSKQQPNHSGVHSDFKESIDTICRSNLEINASIDRDNAGKTNEENAKEQSTRNQNEIERNKAEEPFPKNNSIFYEKLISIQNKGKAMSEKEDGETDQSHSFPMAKMIKTKRKISTVISETHQPKVSGRMHLSIQYFQNSRQLRVILLSAESSVRDHSKIFCKVTLNGNSSRQKKKTHKIKARSGTAEFKEAFYMKTKTDHLSGYLLSVQLCTLSEFFKPARPVGEAIIALEDIDLALDTSFWVQLRDPKSSDKVTNSEDFEIVSEDRSIHAEVTALLQGSEHVSNRYPLMRRHRLMPQIGRYVIH